MAAAATADCDNANDLVHAQVQPEKKISI